MDQLSGLTDSNRKKSLDEIYRQVHSLKGSSTVMGYTAIADLCKKIDDHINNPQIHLSKSETTKSIKELTIELKSQLSALENKDVKDLI